MSRRKKARPSSSPAAPASRPAISSSRREAEAPPPLSKVGLGLVGLTAIVGGVLLTAWVWGDWGEFFRHPARLAVLAGFVAYTMGVTLSGTSGWSSGRREDRANRWIILPMLVLGFFWAWVPPFSDGRNWLVVDGDAMRYAGAAIFWLGTLLRVRAMQILRERFSALVAIQQGHSLVTTGLYGVIRHPAYLGGIWITLGWALAFRSLVGIGLTVALIWFLTIRIRAEEALLLSEFGEEYEEYRRRTWRLVPYLY